VTLKNGSPEAVEKMFNVLRRESENLMESVISVIYFMRGSVSFQEMMCQVTPGVRGLMQEFIDKRLEIESKKMFQNY